MHFLDQPTRNLFFTGKGGVGKTSMACAAAVRLADRGLRVLLVSTDPASNLDEVLQTKLSSRPTPVAGVGGLKAMNIDPEAAAREYRERLVGPYRGILPEAAVNSMEEQLSGSCTLEIAAFDEFSRLLGDQAATAEFDHILFDTAPTGHTLRLLTLPSAWSGFMESNTTGTSCLGPLAGLQEQQTLYQRTVEALKDPERTTLVLVTRPETAAFREAARSSSELQKLGVDHQQLIVNGILRSPAPTDPFAVAMQRRAQEAIDGMPEALRHLERTVVPLSGSGLMGIEKIRGLGSREAETESEGFVDSSRQTLPGDLAPLIDELASAGRGVILTMGKGGVGKTTIASAIAVALAERGHEVHLTTTDPAAHVTTTLAADSIANLSVGRIDPGEETARYTTEVLQTAGADLDEAGRALLEEDLRSPCTEEIAVFRAFAKAVAQGAERFVVLDTAPTGHTVLLLDSALAYHREVTRQASQMPEAVENLLPRLRDPRFTRLLIVTLPEATPVHEAAHLQDDLRRAEMEPFAWVINQSLAPLPVTDALLLQRQQYEQSYIQEVAETLSQRTALVPWQAAPPVGLAALRRVAEPADTSSQEA